VAERLDEAAAAPAVRAGFAAEDGDTLERSLCIDTVVDILAWRVAGWPVPPPAERRRIMNAPARPGRGRRTRRPKGTVTSATRALARRARRTRAVDLPRRAADDLAAG
jgi:hypothetical protein